MATPDKAQPAPPGDGGAVARPVSTAPAPAAADGAPLLIGVRLFMYGSQQDLAQYDLSRLSEQADGAAASQDLARIVDYFRPTQLYAGGIDGVALGLLAAGDPRLPVAFALRTLTVSGHDCVRVSNVAVDDALREFVDLPGLLLVFAAQLPVLAATLLPAVRFLTCEARRGGANYEALARRGLPVAPGKSLLFTGWDPTPEYARAFPSAGADVAYLRADLR
eukprot:CAMPEP_0119277006 /NCGR_PEP_ID=MMETSP1329-20130426/16379_1 /TAXON_ID=114041 /ORGANISM="Genus nov. species nov., Strain RCC1024" /LENGTH=220 /DNA_ID=CAMNT_0007277457 /DNA_START=100 /DNA_END=759 /DNA_ORIENTATION=-